MDGEGSSYTNATSTLARSSTLVTLAPRRPPALESLMVVADGKGGCERAAGGGGDVGNGDGGGSDGGGGGGGGNGGGGGGGGGGSSGSGGR